MDVNGFVVLFTPWGPVLVYGLTAAALLVVNPRRFPRLSQALALLGTWVVAVWVMVWRLVPAPVAHVLVLSPGDAPPLFVRTQVSATIWPLLGVLAALGAAGACVPLRPPAGRVPVLSGGLVLLAGAMVVLVAENLPALLLGWVVLEVGLLTRMGETRGAMPVRALGLSLLTALIVWVIVVTQPFAMAPWSDLVLPEWALALLGLAVWVRLGAYPFHREGERPRRGLPEAWQWAPAVAGVGWLVRWISLPGSERIWGHQVWVFLGVVAVFGSALAAWTSRAPSVRWHWVLIQRMSTLVLVPWVWRGESFLVGSMLGGGVLLAGVARSMLREYPIPRGSRELGWALAAWVWGVPGLLTSPWREVPLSVGAWQPLLGSALFLADALVVSALLLGESSRGPFRWRHALPLGVLVGALLVWNVMAVPLGWVQVGRWWGSALVVGSIGGFLAWQYDRIFVDMRAWAWGIRVLASLEPVEEMIRNVVRWGWMGVGGVLSLLEGAGWVGWLLLAAVLAWVWSYLGG